jgi:predicted GH43/DUF377 family glycosyl hydrolase
MLVKRFAENPLITPADVQPSTDGWEVIGVFNPGVIRFKGQILLLLRVAERPGDKLDDEQVAPILNPATGQIEHLRVKNDDPDVEIPDSRSFYYKGEMKLTSISHLRIARSTDGINFTIDPKPAIFPERPNETYGLEDPRITQIGDEFYIAVKTVSENGICVGLIKTVDFVNFERMGVILCPENLNVMLFPEKIRGAYWALTRPVPFYIGQRGIWICSSPDLLNWGNHKPLVLPEKGTFHSGKTGGSCVPIKTDAGWLEIYHGSDETDRYSLAAVLLDLDDPTKVIARGKVPIMEPQADYEINGFYGNVVFACGAIVEDDGRVIIYYGASDESTAAAVTTIDKIMQTLK